MLEKIGLPAKPSSRGSNWVVGSSHCQGCSSQFTFINRKHHCRRCGGLFCGNCTLQRMVLRGQGDSAVRICDPCKKLEEAERFEMRYGHKKRAGKGSSRMTAKNEDEILNEILGDDRKESSSSGRQSSTDMVSSIQRASSTASFSKTQQVAALDGGGEISRSHSADEHNYVYSEVGSTTPDRLRHRALDEKKRYKILKGEGKSEEALKAFKRGKELGRQADDLELSIRKNNRKVLSSGNTVELQNEDGPKESVIKSKRLAQVNEKDDLTTELRELGWSDMDLHDKDKKLVKISLEGELSSLLGEISGRTSKDTGSSGIDKTQVFELKRKALALKREGKLAEAKEELKKAKILEKQLEEQALLGVDEDSDDEISALIRSMDNDQEDKLFAEDEQDHGFDFNHLVGTADDLGVDGNFEVTDEDLVDPELAATLKSLGWTDDPDSMETTATQSTLIDRENLQSEILSLKREALNHKRAGNVAEAMARLQKAKFLERELESLGDEVGSLIAHNTTTMMKSSPSQNTDAKSNVSSKPAPKSRLMIQKELLAMKKKALSLRREGRLDAAEEELKKGKVLEQQLEEMDNASNVKEKQVAVGSKNPDLENEHPDISGSPIREGEEDVTDQDMHDPAYLSLLRNLGWEDDDNEHANSPFNLPKESDNLSTQTIYPFVTKSTSNVSSRTPRKSKAEIQRELLGLKRKALTLRREGKTDEAEEVLIAAKTLEAQIAEMETPKKEMQIEPNRPKDEIVRPISRPAEEGDIDDITAKYMHDPSLLSITNLGWKDSEVEAVTVQERPSKQVLDHLGHSTDPSTIPLSSSISAARPRSKGEIQRELLGLKRKALSLRRKGETEEAEELLKMAKVLESQMDELEGPKEEPFPDASEDKKYQSSESLNNHKKQNNVDNAVEMIEKLTAAAAAVDPNEKAIESLIGLGRKGSGTTAPPSWSPDIVNPVPFELNEDNRPSVGDFDLFGEIGSLSYSGINQDNEFFPSSHQSTNVMDLLTGDDWSSAQISARNLEDKVDFGSDISCLPEPHVHAGSFRSQLENHREVNSISDVFNLPDAHVHMGPLIHAPKDLGSTENVGTGKREETVNSGKKLHVDETDSAQGFSSQNNSNSLQQEVLARKRKAVALKREGKLAEAREELRQARLLEKSLDIETLEPVRGTHDGSTSVSIALPVQQKYPSVPNLAPKPLSGRDRFKLQQESLSHKRQALKLRREGRVEEAEAEFELAKVLEAQLDETSSNDAGKSSVNIAEPVDDVVVEDLLDPQLLSALKAIGIEDTSSISQSSERPGLAKVSPTKSENNNQERTQLEERIKAEKVKAVNLKRAGKQAEALDALRRAKLFEKKLSSLA